MLLEQALPVLSLSLEVFKASLDKAPSSLL